MKLDLVKIFKAWSIALNPNEKQEELGKKRWKICMECPSKTEILKEKEWSFICSECGCPLNKKVFSDYLGACPSNKWIEVEEEYFGKRKNNKSLI